MTGTHGVGGPSPKQTPPPSQGPQGEASGQITPTMGGLQSYLHAAGHDELFTKFQTAMIMSTMQQTQHSLDRAKEAARKMREQQ